jgi:cell division protein FtsW
MEDYWLTLTDPAHEPHDQVVYSNAAIASGQLFGKGAGKGVEKYYIANSVSDMIFPVIILEYGSVFGGLVTILLYLGLLFRGVGIATISKTFGALLAASLSFMLAFQAMINMGVSVGLLPVTGLQLPMLSMGGTSIVFTGLALGIILSVSRHAIENSSVSTEESQ